MRLRSKTVVKDLPDFAPFNPSTPEFRILRVSNSSATYFIHTTTSQWQEIVNVTSYKETSRTGSDQHQFRQEIKTKQ